MTKILVYGFPLDANFGGPSVVHDLRAALKRVCPNVNLLFTSSGVQQGVN